MLTSLSAAALLLLLLPLVTAILAVGFGIYLLLFGEALTPEPTRPGVARATRIAPVPEAAPATASFGLHSPARIERREPEPA
ncbi:hypothetical protein [Muricoccus pecuniae]|uniref:Uncharacterized protein n=1 Tax=Muricoccus pecuniae TaxID=693023 RepID=A0A840YKA4_9PROT|nr:hypothetical protein [Roseomonas pecuniae]MBB5694843.1 hypothetical protein [Roseomonas pecuniae]